MKSGNKIPQGVAGVRAGDAGDAGDAGQQQDSKTATQHPGNKSKQLPPAGDGRQLQGNRGQQPQSKLG